jgi:hypothetical protein
MKEVLVTMGIRKRDGKMFSVTTLLDHEVRRRGNERRFLRCEVERSDENIVQIHHCCLFLSHFEMLHASTSINE